MRIRSMIWALLWPVCAAASGVFGFWIASEVRGLRDSQSSLLQDITFEHQKLRVLAADWSYLTRPDRLALLAGKHLDMQLLPIEKLQDAFKPPEVSPLGNTALGSAEEEAFPQARAFPDREAARTNAQTTAWTPD